jgi:hypothetical protein
MLKTLINPSVGCLRLRICIVGTIIALEYDTNTLRKRTARKQIKAIIVGLSTGLLDGKDIEKAFSSAAYTIKEGQIIVKDGEILVTPMGTLIQAEGKIKESVYETMLEDIQLHWRDHYSINFNNYAV